MYQYDNRNELIVTMLAEYLWCDRRLLRAEHLLRKFTLEQSGKEPLQKGGKGLLIHYACKMVAHALPKRVIDALECKVLFVTGSFEHSPWGGPFPAFGYKGGNKGMCEVKLTDPVADKFDEMLWLIRGKKRRSNEEPAVGPAAYRKKVLDDAASGGDRPGGSGDQLHVAARVDRAERATASPVGRSDPTDGGGPTA